MWGKLVCSSDEAPLHERFVGEAYVKSACSRYQRYYSKKIAVKRNMGRIESSAEHRKANWKEMNVLLEGSGLCNEYRVQNYGQQRRFVCLIQKLVDTKWEEMVG